ncbi:MAG: TolC family outer membrane protein [Hyphomicrobiaceae bacterium]
MGVRWGLSLAKGGGAALAGLMLAGLLVAAGAGGASAESLKQALGAAYKFNPRLDAARAIQRATDEEVPRALSGYRPKVSGSADTTYEIESIKPSVGSRETTEGNPRGYAVGLTQPLFRGFRTKNAVSLAEATVRAGWEALRSTEASVMLEAVTAYLDVVRDQAIVTLRDRNVKVLTQDLEATQARFQAGEVTRTDVEQAKARRAGSVAALDLARANLKTSRATFERVVGHPPSRLVEPKATFLAPKTLAESTDIALKESPEVVAALYREQVARFNIDLIRGELLPTVQLEANYAKRFDPSPQIKDAEDTTVTGRLTVPFYTGGEVEARVRQAKQTHIQRLQEIEQARSEVQAQVVTAWSQLQAAKAAVESDLVAVAANDVALKGVREEEKVGQRTLLDVLNAEQELLNAQVTLVTDRRNVVVASYVLVSSIGRLNAQELGVSSLIYDPEQHYQEVRDKWFDLSITHADGTHETMAPPKKTPPPPKR